METKLIKEPHFAGLLQGEKDMEAAHHKNVVEAHRRAGFHQEFDRLGSSPDLEALREFVQRNNDLREFRSAELMQVFNAFREQEAFEDMVRLFEKSGNRHFRNSQIAREGYAVACNNTGQYNTAIKICNHMLLQGEANGEVYGSLGGAYWRKYEAALRYQYACENPAMPADIQARFKKDYLHYFPADQKMQRVKKNAQLCLVRSRNHCRQGFLHAFEYYPGINAVFSMMELKDFDQMKKMARLVHLACLRDGARDTMDADCAATMLEAACFMGASKNQMATTMKAFLKLNMSEHKLNKVSEHLAMIRYRLAMAGQNTALFDEVHFKLDDMRGEYRA